MDSSRRKVVKANYTSTLGLQGDVLIEVLSKMPVKSLLKFRCVSQEWYALTKSSYFISRHLVHQSSCSDRHHPCFIFLSYLAGTSENNFEPLGVTLLRNEETTVLRLPFYSNLTSQRRGLRLVGSSNGLVCCVLLIGIENDKNRTTEGEEDNALLYQQFIVVWNPATEQFRFLPKPNNDIALNQDEKEDIVRLMDNSLLYSLIGFDFVNDHDITEYKLVRVFNHDSDDPNPGEVVTTFRVQVFVQSTNSWRLVENELRFPSCVNSFALTAVTINGVLYWKAQGARDECCVLSFNLREEVFNVIQLPKDLQNQEDWGECPLYSWRNSLATLTLDFSNTNDVNAMLWVMSTDDQVSQRSCERGAQVKKPAWTPQFRFKNSVIEDMTRLLGSWKDQILYASERSDEVVSSSTAADNIVPHDLFAYDPKCEIKRKILKDGERIKFCYGVNYVESLVPV